MTRVALYARVSTKEQDDSGTSLDTQMAALEKYAAEHNFSVVGSWREDFTGTKYDRPKINLIKEMAERGQLDAILCFSRDRYARSRIAGLMLDMHFKEAGVERLYVMREKSQDTPQGMVRDGLDDLMHEYEVAMFKERTQRGKRAFVEQGTYLGLGGRLYGYKKTGRKERVRIAINDEPIYSVPDLTSEAAIVRWIFKAYVYEGMGASTIVHHLNAHTIPSPGTAMNFSFSHGSEWLTNSVYLILKREEYTGVFYAYKFQQVNGQRVKVPKEQQVRIDMPELALIDRETFDLAQEKLKTNRGNKGKFDYLMARRIKCIHGHRMVCSTHTREHKQRAYYSCRRRSTFSRVGCDMPYFRVDQVDGKVWEFATALIEDPEAQIIGFQKAQQIRQGNAQSIYASIESCKRLIKQHEEELAYLIEEAQQFKDNHRVRETYREKIGDCSNKLEILEQEKRGYEATLEQVILTDDDIQARISSIEKIRSHIEHLDRLSFAHKRRIVELLNIEGTLLVQNGEQFLDIHWYEEVQRVCLNSSLCQSARC